MFGRNTEKIRKLNDAFRRSFIGGRVLMTPGVSALGYEDQAGLLQLVRCFKDFTEDNDPYGEHDFGVIEFRGGG